MKRISLIFTLDYEVFGNGEGDPYKLMINPTYRLMSLLERYGAKLTIMAEVAEISKFKEYYDKYGIDKYHYQDIKHQLQDALKRGHSVQLHIHSAFFNASYKNNNWQLCNTEYDLASLPFERLYEIVSKSVSFLNKLLSEGLPEYHCSAFRAGGWGMMPTSNLYSALLANGITKDTSVYKWGKNYGLTNYDYSSAYSNMCKYPASPIDINKYDKDGRVVEYPIYSEYRSAFSFFSIMRAYRFVTSLLHKTKHKKNDDKKSSSNNVSETLLGRKSLKYDYNKLTTRQMIKMYRHCESQIGNTSGVEVVLIGHSKSFTQYNERTLKGF